MNLAHVQEYRKWQEANGDPTGWFEKEIKKYKARMEYAKWCIKNNAFSMKALHILRKRTNEHGQIV